MHNLYDRAECATELRIRNAIVQCMREGRLPVRAFEIATGENELQLELASSSADSTSETSTVSEVRRNCEDISKLDE